MNIFKNNVSILSNTGNFQALSSFNIEDVECLYNDRSNDCSKIFTTFPEKLLLNPHLNDISKITVQRPKGALYNLAFYNLAYGYIKVNVDDKFFYLKDDLPNIIYHEDTQSVSIEIDTGEFDPAYNVSDKIIPIAITQLIMNRPSFPFPSGLPNSTIPATPIDIQGYVFSSGYSQYEISATLKYREATYGIGGSVSYTDKSEEVPTSAGFYKDVLLVNIPYSYVHAFFSGYSNLSNFSIKITIYLSGLFNDVNGTFLFLKPSESFLIENLGSDVEYSREKVLGNSAKVDLTWHYDGEPVYISHNDVIIPAREYDGKNASKGSLYVAGILNSGEYVVGGFKTDKDNAVYANLSVPQIKFIIENPAYNASIDYDFNIVFKKQIDLTQNDNTSILPTP